MLAADYLIVGAGAVGLIFADELLNHSDARIVLVDRRHRPGGHWNDAYPFVRLHQPSVYYGAGSRELGSSRIETRGPNAGLYEQASGPEINAYFEQLMRQRLLPSGRVQFFPMHEYVGDWTSDHRIVSLVTGEETPLYVASRLVDTTFYRVSSPSTHTPGFEVRGGVTVVPPNDLPKAVAPFRNYVVLGGGKTSMDVVVWLLRHGARPDAIKWVVPRDSWLVNRETIQPGDAGFVRKIESLANRLDAAAHATSLNDLYARLERAGEVLRIDPHVQPAMFHGATISPGELKLLRRVKNVIRAGHVERIEPGVLTLEAGERPSEPDAVYIDCTARGITWGPTRPVFQDKRITMQIIRDGRLSLSAAAIAYVEATVPEARKNDLCRPIPYEEHLITWPRAMLTELMNGAEWAKVPALHHWARAHRLTGFGSSPGGEADARLEALNRRIAALRPTAMANLTRLIGAHDARAGSRPAHAA